MKLPRTRPIHHPAPEGFIDAFADAFAGPEFIEELASTLPRRILPMPAAIPLAGEREGIESGE